MCLKYLNKLKKYHIAFILIEILIIFLEIEASCKDGRTNQGELGTDCGGPCPPCGKYSWNYQVTQKWGTF